MKILCNSSRKRLIMKVSNCFNELYLFFSKFIMRITKHVEQNDCVFGVLFENLIRDGEMCVP